jgi:phage/plasmid-like protein (TIGR03299 family)
MAHEIEVIAGKAQMAYSGDVPWHSLGTRVPDDLTPEQMLDAAGLNWNVNLIPAYAKVAGKNVSVGRSALVRSTDNKILDVVSDDWKPMQNSDAFDFFTDFIAAGDMSMHTAGSLKGGQIVWALAKVNDGFELFGGDNVESYLLFTNPHTYGKSIDVRFTPIRVVCNNTLTLSLNTQSDNMVKVSHRREFIADQVKETLGIAKEKLETYKEMAAFLGSKRYTNENIVEYYKRVFPLLTSNENKSNELSRNAKLALEVVNSQPGANYAEGTWWSAANGVTYMTNHLIGRSADTRLTSTWYGANKSLNHKAFELAVEMANAA